MADIKNVYGIFLPGPKSVFLACFSPFFTYIVAAMRLKKRAKQAENPSFLSPAKNPEHVLSKKFYRLRFGISPRSFLSIINYPTEAAPLSE
ncbi:MAG: hypothetical protein H6565_17265 [Lewinellaceae bacterium]|nr:hypothetical protein [Lewinellaceae bacterium]MCB9356810.1 hypothetical protein [Lewinellaceae bacterium]